MRCFSRMARQSSILFVSQLLFFAFAAAALNDIWLSVPYETAPLPSQIVARFLVKYFGSHIHTRQVKQIVLMTQFSNDSRPNYDNNISNLMNSIQFEFSYRFFRMERRRQLDSFGASVVIFLVADLEEWQ